MALCLQDSSNCVCNNRKTRTDMQMWFSERGGGQAAAAVPVPVPVQAAELQERIVLLQNENA